MRLKEKLLIAIALLVYFCLFYFTLQRVVVFVPHQFVPSRVDDAISFDPRWTLVYQSIYLLLPLPLLLSIEDVRRYARGFLMMTILSFAIFLVFPVEGPRPDVMVHNRAYDLLITYDRNLNAFPSLHAALAVYTLIFLRRLRFFAVLAIGVALMLYATIATKQHYAIDIVAGIVVGIGASYTARS